MCMHLACTPANHHVRQTALLFISQHAITRKGRRLEHPFLNFVLMLKQCRAYNSVLAEFTSSPLFHDRHDEESPQPQTPCLPLRSHPRPPLRPSCCACLSRTRLLVVPTTVRSASSTYQTIMFSATKGRLRAPARSATHGSSSSRFLRDALALTLLQGV